MAKDDDLEEGDEVTWNYAGNEVAGKVVKRLTEETQIKGHKVAASEDNPEYLVESDKTGKQAAHKPGALKKDD
jgi:hypothetical protein